MFEVTDNGALRLLHHVSLRSLRCSATETMAILAATILVPSTTTTAEWNSLFEAAVHFSREGYTWARDKVQHPVPHLMTRWTVPLRLASNPGA
ncbi:hypothetical protein F2Q69_00004938 [Brassica cretica]|uniref:Uncharacterized protein n=1 Tax=Brassica cretica TaxID=69181 RepID=A0A8S9P9H5_BRACR|nr:hypothetical protein F2Q69_00004938 [Brassica cretica]